MFQHGSVILVYPANFSDTAANKSIHKYLNELSSDLDNSKILADTTVLKMNTDSCSILAIGTLHNNSWIRGNTRFFPFSINESEIRTDKVYPGDRLVLTSCLPNNQNPEKGLFLIIGQTESALLNLNHSEDYWISDWSVLDNNGCIAIGNYMNKAGSWSFEPAGQYKDLSGQARWIWYPGDFAVELNKNLSLLRKERNQFYPPLWRLDAPYGMVSFYKNTDLDRSERIAIYAAGEFTVVLDGKRLNDFDPGEVFIPAGKHILNISVANYSSLPSLLVKGKYLISDTTWRVSFGWRYPRLIPESWKFSDRDNPPASFRLAVKPVPPIYIKKTDSTLIADFGQETIGRIILENVLGRGKVLIIYGETLEEALSGKLAETWEYRELNYPTLMNDTLPEAMAFRYVCIRLPDKGISVGNITHLYEYLPVEQTSTFECSDTVLNKIFNVASRTLLLNSRELLLDGIKRDRWCWSGDVFIGCLLDYYHFFDEDLAKRSLMALRGHDPVIQHINTIPDYTFYWFLAMYNHFLFSGDTLMIRNMYDNMRTLMLYCLSRTNENGFIKLDPSIDWIFVDWAKTPKYGNLSFEQILFSRSLEIMSLFSGILERNIDKSYYDSLAISLKTSIHDKFWDENQHSFIHSLFDDIPEGALKINSNFVSRYSNIYGLLFGYIDSVERTKIKETVLLNESVPEVKLPFHRIFELSALYELGESVLALDKMKNYWNGMIKLGATSFWEDFDSTLSSADQYMWSGRPFGKSLCHLWGASPLLIYGKYIMGLSPVEAGYKSYLVQPDLSGLSWFKASMPVKGKLVEVSMNKSTITVISGLPNGICRFHSKKRPKVSFGTVTRIGENYFEMPIEKDIHYEIRYF